MWVSSDNQLRIARNVTRGRDEAHLAPTKSSEMKMTIRVGELMFRWGVVETQESGRKTALVGKVLNRRRQLAPRTLDTSGCQQFWEETY